MGVMSCSRRCCSNVMCDTYIPSVGYVCYDCQKEFEQWLDKNEAHPKTEDEIAKHLKVFMSIDRSGYDDVNEISVSEFFRNHVKDR